MSYKKFVLIESLLLSLALALSVTVLVFAVQLIYPVLSGVLGSLCIGFMVLAELVRQSYYEHKT